MAQDQLKPLFDQLQGIRSRMSTADQRLLDDLEARSKDGPALTAREVAFLKAWPGRIPSQ